MARASLTELANRYGTDKGTVGPSQAWGARNYTDIYGAYLEQVRDLPLTVLEIGLGVVGDKWNAMIVHGSNTGGASMKMWYDYFSRARIYGIDVNACPYLDNDRIRTFVADQGNPSELDRCMAAAGHPEFDIIFDDGSHRPEHQQTSLGYFFPRLKPGGLYFIEDLLANGLGDGASGRMASDQALSTRRVLRQFREAGNFPEPHALGDAAYLARHIAELHFHVPEINVEVTQSGTVPPTFSAAMRFELDKPRLCVLRKAPAAVA